MNQMEIFKNPEFGNVRVIDEDGKYLFCGTDVARALGYSIPSKAVNTHCKGVSKMEAPTNGGVQKLLFIPEGDVYRLIVHSKLPSAERFERWVFDEVLPTIRQHGAYLTREKLWEVATSPEALLKLCSDLLAEREKMRRCGRTTPGCKARPSTMTCSSTCDTVPTCAPPPRSWTCRNGGSSAFCWNAGTSTALRRAVCCPTPKAATRACSVSGFLPQRPHRLLHAGDAKGQAALCGTSVPDFGDGMTGRHLLRRLVVPP